MPIDTLLNVGSAVVDLRLPGTVRQGETVVASVHTVAGDEPQQVDAVHATFDVAYESEGEGNPDSLHSLGRQQLVGEPFVIEPGEDDAVHRVGGGTPGVDEEEADGDESEGEETEAEGEADDADDGVDNNALAFDVELRVPEAAPITRPPEGEAFPDGDGEVAGYPTVAVETSMDGEFAVDPSDEDPLTVEMGGRFETFHRAMTEELSFDLVRVQRGRLQEGLKRWTQRFEYEPRESSPYVDTLDEVEAQLDYGHEGPGLGIEIQFDPLESDPFELGESYDEFVVESTDPAVVAAAVRERADEV